jgi:hypothetical protein
VTRVLRAAIVASAVIGALSAPAASTAVAHARPAPAPAPAVRRSSSPPVVAYYYIWFDRNSWSRAKTDLPKLGPYSSDDAVVMRQHVRSAKRAGIEGFLVSWKHTPTLDRRLRQLVDIAEREEFGLGIVYQGLDFHREPLPVDRVAADLDFFAASFAARVPFTFFGRPLIVWSGTWRFSPEDITRVTGSRRRTLAILASERNVEGYARIADSVDGDAYYWSSVNPSTYPGYVEKLTDLGRDVHRHGGLWIAPAAPGFDARAIGGTSKVARKGAQTLLYQVDAALASSPDALAIISWNEFSENSHIEPSVRYGSTALNAVGVRLGDGPVGALDRGTGVAVDGGTRARARPARATGGLDAATSTPSGSRSGLWVIAGFAFLFVVLVTVMARRASRSTPLHVISGTERGASQSRPNHQAVAHHPGWATAHRSRGRAPCVEAGRGVEGAAHRVRRKPMPWYRILLNELPARRRGRGT